MMSARNLWRNKTALILVGAAIAIGIVSFGVFRFAKAVPRIPSVMVQRGEFVDYLTLRGDIKAGKSVTIAAPPQTGTGNLQILKIAPNGVQVKPGDVVVEFDTTLSKQTLAQDQSDLKSSEAGIEQSLAQSRIKEEQDLTDVMKARYDAETAKLEASKSDIVSKIDGQEAQFKLADAEQKLKEVQAKLKSDQDSDAADIRGKEEKRQQALFQVRQTEGNLQHLVLKAPQAGMLTIDMNESSGGPFSNGAPFKAGDRAWSGAAIAELPDLSTLRVSARVGESERGNLQLGQKASIRVDAIPDREFTGTVSQISNMASMDFSAPYPFPKNFSLIVTLQDRDARLRPGMSANTRIAVDRFTNVIVIPPQAVFQKPGNSVVYLVHGGKYEERTVEVARRNASQVLVTKGLQAGEYVALKDPGLAD